MARNGYQHMVLDHYVGVLRETYAERSARLRSITTRGQAEAYQAEVRDAIARAFSPLPQRTDLKARVVGVVEHPTYRIEKVTLESRPGFLVTALLYVPSRLDGPAPCVLGTCGHAESGKGYVLYQEFPQRLVQSGFVVLVYDPINQGERDQYYGLDNRESVAGCCAAHNMMGKQLELVGDFFGTWRAWDGIRALDYLLSRPEVDPARIGVTGNSGGGTMSTWLWALDDRFTMAAPSCFITSFLNNLENELPADAEQCPPGVIGAGLDLADFLIAQAPKPVLLLGQNYDFFDRRGLRVAHEEVARFWKAMGAPAGNVDLFVGSEGHGYFAPNQQAMVEFFARHAGVPTVGTGAVDVHTEDSLLVTPAGNVVVAGSVPAYKLIAEESRKLAKDRSDQTLDGLRTGLKQLLALPDERPLPHFRVPRPIHSVDDVFARFAIETEQDIRALLWKQLADRNRGFTLDVEPEVNLYLPHVSSEIDLVDEQDELPELLMRTPPLYALDVRGLGESLPDEEGSEFLGPYGMDYMMHAYGLMLGRSYLGQRVHDVLCTLDLLVQQGAQVVHLYGRGQGAVPSLLAALFHDHVGTVTLKNGPRSFSEWTETPLVAWPAASAPRGILRLCDVADCTKLLGDRVRIIEPWGPDMRSLT